MGQFKVTQTKSTIKRIEPQKRTMIALGLGKIGRTVVHNDTPQIRGMIEAVRHLVDVEKVD